MKKILVVFLGFLLASCAKLPPSVSKFLNYNDGTSCSAARTAMADFSTESRLRYGFYADFNPLSYAPTLNEFSQQANTPKGFEPALIEAVTIFSKGDLQFQAIAIPNPFKGIWLKSASADFDLVGGGITALESRRYSKLHGQTPLINFGEGHVSFRQSLLTRADSTIASYQHLNSSHRIGALAGTTGEARFLEIVGYVDHQGYLLPGSLVEYPLQVEFESHQGDVLSAAVQSKSLDGRVAMSYVSKNLPKMVYFDDETSALEALENGDIDAFARGEIGNIVAATQANNAPLKVAVIDTAKVEYGAFSYPATAEGDQLRSVMDAVITCLTDDRKIGFSQWSENNKVFADRAIKNR